VKSYLLRRLLGTVPVLIVSSILVFLVIHLIPGDPVLNLLPPNPLPEQIKAVRESYGFDQPLLVQYLIWLGNVFQGKLGNSISNGFNIGDLLRLKLAVTVQLAIAGMLLALITAFPLGLVAGLRPKGWIASGLNIYTTLGFAVPNFWLGILLILFFGVFLRVLPTSGYKSIFEDPLNAIRFLFLPAFTLSIATSVVLANFLRFSIEEVMRSEFITAAIARGLPYHRVVLRHALKNAMIPVITIITLQLGGMLGGAVITESLFSVPGLGRLIVDAISGRDYPLIQASLLLVVLIFVGLNFVTDLFYGWLDPRIRLS
jgi:peptide/nickel transport system permease protein